MFGGIGLENKAHDDMIVIQVKEDDKTQKPQFSIIKPKTFGQGP
jgi:hypothetical protein